MSIPDLSNNLGSDSSNLFKRTGFQADTCNKCSMLMMTMAITIVKTPTGEKASAIAYDV